MERFDPFNVDDELRYVAKVDRLIMWALAAIAGVIVGLVGIIWWMVS